MSKLPVNAKPKSMLLVPTDPSSRTHVFVAMSYAHGLENLRVFTKDGTLLGETREVWTRNGNTAWTTRYSDTRHGTAAAAIRALIEQHRVSLRSHTSKLED